MKGTETLALSGHQGDNLRGDVDNVDMDSDNEGDGGDEGEVS